MANDERVNVEVAYARADTQAIIAVAVAPGTTLGQAVELSKIRDRFPEIDLKSNKTGIFGKATKVDQIVREGDRIEIYRPLIADPKQVRKERAAAGKGMKKGVGSEEDGE